jgi:multiple sugar transport system ATP-binding protein
VAGFIGSPAMNFIPCRLLPDRAGLEFLAPASAAELPMGMTAGPASAVLSLTEGTRQRLANKPVTGDLVLGVRPEDIELSRAEKPEFLRAEVYVVEPLGSENIVDLRLAGHVFKARTAPTFTAGIGDPMWTRIDQSRMHLFDAQTTEALF